jgi:hypothetical protein
MKYANIKMDRRNRTDKKIVVVSLIVFFAIIGFWLKTPYIIRKFEPTFDDRGITGDMFGVVNSLFSGLALAGLFYTIILQKQELKEARESFEEEISLMRLSVDREKHVNHMKNEPVLILLSVENFSEIEKLHPQKLINLETRNGNSCNQEYETEFYHGYHENFLYLRNFGEAAYSFTMRIRQKDFVGDIRYYETSCLYRDCVFQIRLNAKYPEYNVFISYINQLGYKVDREFEMNIKHVNLFEFNNSFLDKLLIDDLNYHKDKLLIKAKYEIIDRKT